MYTYIFSGKVHPERACIDHSPLDLRYTSLQDNDEYDIKIEIHCSQISVKVKTEREVKNILSLRNMVKHAVQGQIDIFGFTTGRAYDIEIVSCEHIKTGEYQVFGVDEPILNKLCSKKNLEFQEIFFISQGKDGMFLRGALANFRESIRTPNDTGFFCYRAIESILQYFINKYDLTKKKGWQKLHSALNTDRSTIDEDITPFSAPQRHGDLSSMTGRQRDKCLETTWLYLYKFCKHLKEK